MDDEDDPTGEKVAARVKSDAIRQRVALQDADLVDAAVDVSQVVAPVPVYHEPVKQRSQVLRWLISITQFAMIMILLEIYFLYVLPRHATPAVIPPPQRRPHYPAFALTGDSYTSVPPSNSSVPVYMTDASSPFGTNMVRIVTTDVLSAFKSVIGNSPHSPSPEASYFD